MIHWKHYENFLKAEPLIEEVNKLLTGLESGSFGIGQVSNDARMAYDLHQIIRHRLAHDNKKEGDDKYDLFLREPRQHGWDKRVDFYQFFRHIEFLDGDSAIICSGH